LVASPAVNKSKTVGKQQDNYMLTKECGAQKRGWLRLQAPTLSINLTK